MSGSVSPIQPDLAPVQTVAIAGSKGGIGKTNIAVNLSVALSQAGQEVLLLDGDLGLGNVDQLMQLRPSQGLRDVISGLRDLQDVLMDGPAGVTVIPAINGLPEMARLSQIEHAGLIGLFSELPTTADTLVVDVASGLSESMTSFCQAAREVLVVIVDEPTAMQDAFSTIRVLNERCQIQRFRLVANKTRSSQHGLDLYDRLVQMVDRNLDVLLDYCGAIPTDPQLQLAVGRQMTVMEAYPRSPSALAFKKLGSRVSRWPKPQMPVGHIEFFVERLIQPAIGAR